MAIFSLNSIHWTCGSWIWILVTALAFIVGRSSGLECDDPHVDVPFGEEEPDGWEWEEFTTFCEGLLKIRSTKQGALEGALKECDEDVFDVANLRMLFVLMLMIAHGAFVRTVLRYFQSGLPYTVVLMLSGLLIGYLSSHFCDSLHTFTAIARIPPKIILFVFLPVLIFESAFSITPHIFVRSAGQILILALAGMIVATFLTAVMVQQFLTRYDWTFLEASLFGSILSATDPVAVVAILRELGTSETLGMMIEGESLLNDGVAILLYEIIEKIITCQIDKEVGIPLFILRKFCQITLGGPVFGWVMGKIAIICLSIIFNDATVEITITLVSAYLTYYIGEDFLGVSGVMAVVVLGITMASERTAISPEVESFVHHFWEMLGYLANTVLFMIVGIVITETALSNIEIHDWVYLIFLYIMLNIIRFIMLIIMYPIVSRLGYGMTWQNMIVIMWGGLRGAVGICLSLDVYDNKHLCNQLNLGPKFLFQTAGIVFLTLVLNGTTTKLLLEVLRLTEISAGRLQDMANAMRQLEMAQLRTISMLKHDRFVADANWTVVDKFTSIANPYAKNKAPTDLPPTQSLVSLKVATQDHHTECPDCHAIVENEPTIAEYTEMTEEARLRVLKALKVSFWRQFEQGVLIEIAVQILVNVSSAAEDKPLRLVRSSDLKKYWNIRGCLPWMKTKFTKTFGLDDEILPSKPKNKFSLALWWLATREWFEYLIIIIILLNMIPAIWETVIFFRCRNKEKTEACHASKTHQSEFLMCTIAFNTLYLLEFLIKVIGRRPRDYFCTHKSNWLDVIVLVLGIIDIILTLCELQVLPAVSVIKLIRVSRAIRLFRPLVPRMMGQVDKKINAQLFLGYDVGKGFVTAVDDVIKFLPQMVDHPKVLRKLKQTLERERLETVREMGIMQKDHPGIAIAVKTRHASRAVLNQMREALLELKEDGLVDEKECDLLMVCLEEKMKRLWDSPPSIPPAPPESLLANIPWVGGNQELYDYILNEAELISFPFNDTICKSGDPPNGIFVITSGMIKVHYVPTNEVVQRLDLDGEIPNMEVYVDLSFRSKEDDFFSTGTVIGEKSVLTGQTRAASVKCETSVLAYHISQAAMQAALKRFRNQYDSLESRIWRSVGMKLAVAVLPKHPTYSVWPVDKIRLHVERSAVPVGDRFDELTIPSFVSEILVIHGKVKDAFSDEIYVAPSLVPRTVSKIKLKFGSNDQARILVIAQEEEVQASGGVAVVKPMEKGGYTESAAYLQKCIDASVDQDKYPVDFEQNKTKQVNNFGVRKAKRDLSQKRIGFPKSVTKRKNRGSVKVKAEDILK